MPAVFDSLVQSRGLSPHQAWRVAYIVPFIIIVAVALGMLLTCDDTPTGKWSERHIWNREDDHPKDNSSSNSNNIVDIINPSSPASLSKNPITDIEKKGGADSPNSSLTPETGIVTNLDALRTNDTVIPLSRKDASKVLLSLSTAAVAIPYACSFGSELAINSILGDYYAANFPHLGQTQSGKWAAMFGLLNVVFRPAGGLIGDILYQYTHSVWSKKLFLSFLGVVMGAFQLAMGLSDPKSQSTMFGLTAGLAFFLEASNGANFAVVPHVHPFANGESIYIPCPGKKVKQKEEEQKLTQVAGLVSGAVGGMGNLGGIIFAIIFRYNDSDYARALWIIGVISIAANLAVAWVRPVPKGLTQQ